MRRHKTHGAIGRQYEKSQTYHRSSHSASNKSPPHPPPAPPRPHPATDIVPRQPPDNSLRLAPSSRSSLTPITGTSNRISCFGFAIFTTVSARLSVEASPSERSFMSCAGPLNRRVRSFHGFDRNARRFCDHDRLPNVELPPAAAPPTRPYSMFFRSCSVGARRSALPISPATAPAVTLNSPA